MLSRCLLLLAAAPFQWPEVEAIGVVEVPPVVSNGSPTLLKAVKVKHPVDELFPLFRAAFVKAGLWVPKPVRLLREPMLTALDPVKRRSYTVVFQPNPDGTTTLILSEVNHAVRVAEEGELAPLFPGATKRFRSTQEGARLEAYEVAAKVEDVKAFYAEVLPKGGWLAQPEEGGWRRAGEQLALSVTAEGRTARVMLALTRR